MWFQAYLENTRQRVIRGESSLSWQVPKLGVPQGSNLGSCLFVLFVNNLPRARNTGLVNRALTGSNM